MAMSYKISNAIFDMQQEIVQSHPFLMSRKLETQGCQRYVVKRIKSTVFLRIWGIVELGLGHLFITSSSTHLFNKIHHEQCYWRNG